ncbi:MAG: hypothetical protein ACR2Q4_15545 [Geminicoccaceae bacterium]
MIDGLIGRFFRHMSDTTPHVIQMALKRLVSLLVSIRVLPNTPIGTLFRIVENHARRGIGQNEGYLVTFGSMIHSTPNSLELGSGLFDQIVNIRAWAGLLRCSAQEREMGKQWCGDQTTKPLDPSAR